MESANYKKHTTRNPIRGYFIRNFSRVLGDCVEQIQPKSILEVGCGEGFIIKSLRARFPETKCCGIDINENVVRLAECMNPESAFQTMDIYNLSEQSLKVLSGTTNFDLVVCLEVLEHLKDFNLALEILAGINSANFILSVPNEPFFRLANLLALKNIRLLGNDAGHVNNWNITSFNKLAEKCFDVIDRRYPFPWQMLICKKKKL